MEYDTHRHKSAARISQPLSDEKTGLFILVVVLVAILIVVVVAGEATRT